MVRLLSSPGSMIRVAYKDAFAQQQVFAHRRLAGGRRRFLVLRRTATVIVAWDWRRMDCKSHRPGTLSTRADRSNISIPRACVSKALSGAADVRTRRGLRRHVRHR